MRLTIILSMSILLFSCKTNKMSSTEQNNSEGTNPTEIIENVDITPFFGNYYITSLEAMPEIQNITPTFTLRPGGKVSGFNGCNNYFGQINTEDEIWFRNLASTRKACQGEGEQIERLITDVFNVVTGIEKNEEGIVFYMENQPVMWGKELTLEGGTWEVISIEGEEYKEMPSFLIENGRIEGSTECNSFFGKVEQDGFNFQIKEYGMTERACLNGNMVMESTFSRMISQITRFEKTEEYTIFYSQGDELFRAINPEQE